MESLLPIRILVTCVRCHATATGCHKTETPANRCHAALEQTAPEYLQNAVLRMSAAGRYKASLLMTASQTVCGLGVARRLQMLNVN